MQNQIALKINKKIYYGWVILFVAVVGYFFSSPGQTYSISTFIDSYIKEFNYSRTFISSIYSVATIISGSTLVFMGKAVDRYGHRKMLIITGVMLSIATLFNSFIINLPMVFIGFFLLRYFGQGSLLLIPGSLVPQWFEKRRAFALSILAFGTIIGNLFIPLINNYLIDLYGFRTAWQMWSVFIVLVFIPIMAFFVINKPEDIGLLPDNIKVKTQEEVKEELEKVTRESFSLNEALKTKEFWIIGIISMLVPMISTGMMFHFFSLMGTKGIDRTSASFIIGLIAIPGFVVPIVASTVVDRFRPKYVLSISAVLMAISLGYMIIVSNIIGAIIFILFFGLVSNIQMLTINVIWVKYFGRLYLGSIKGAATAFLVIGSALGTVPFGLSFDVTGSYEAVFGFMAVVTLMSTILSMILSPPKKKLSS